MPWPKPWTGRNCAIPRAPSRTTFCATWMPTWSQFEAACTAAGGKVHWARDADEANSTVIDIIRSHGASEVIKVKTMTSDETALNPALEAAGITPIETDLADLIIQLGSDKPSHIVVPALHRNKAEIRRLFMEKMKLQDLGERAEDLAAAARRYLRERFLRVPRGFERGELRHRRIGLPLRGGIGRQRPHVRHPAQGPDQPGGHRKDHSHLRRSGSVPATAGALGYRRAHEPVQLHLDRRYARRRPARVPRGAAR